MLDRQQRRPVVEMLESFTGTNPISFHVPGHKGGEFSGLPASVRGMLSWDVTELPGLDDLHAPEGPILEAQQLLSEAYGAGRSFFLVNGSTGGNLAMILSVCRPDDRVIVQRNAHKSIFNGLALAGARPVFLTPEWDVRTMAAGHVPAALVREAIRLYPGAKAVILTNPTYYGRVSPELGTIAEACRRAGIPLLVDEAHGSHFGIGKPFPEPALRQGADVVVQSAHKTLPAMTMASFLHVSKDSLVDPSAVARQLGILQSSSPSYPLMASLDDARHFIATYQSADIRSFLDRRRFLIEGLTAMPSLSVIEADDPLKLLLRTEGRTGTDLQRALGAQGVHAELADDCQALLVLPLLKEGQDDRFAETLGRIGRALQDLPAAGNHSEPEIPSLPSSVTASVLPPAENPQSPAEWVHYTESADRISAASVIPYPPGIPLLLPGEPIRRETVGQLGRLLKAGVPFQGHHRLEDGQVLVLLQSSEAYSI